MLRTEYTLALLEDRDEKAAKKILDQFEKRVARYPYHQTVETERRLLALAAEKANSVPAV